MQVDPERFLNTGVLGLQVTQPEMLHVKQLPPVEQDWQKFLLSTYSEAVQPEQLYET
jgi:hypothetical protein